MKDSVVYRWIMIAMSLLLIAALAAVSVGWSLVQTYEFTQSAIGSAMWGLALALVIQLGPTVILVFGSDAKGGAFIAVIASFLVLTAIDVGTNVGEMNRMYSAMSPAPTSAQMALGYTLAILVVAAEEALAWIIVKMIDQYAHILEDSNREPPAWLFAVQSGASDASGRSAARSRANALR